MLERDQRRRARARHRLPGRGAAMRPLRSLARSDSWLGAEAPQTVEEVAHTAGAKLAGGVLVGQGPAALRARPAQLADGQPRAVAEQEIVRRLGRRSEERRVGKECRSRWAP